MLKLKSKIVLITYGNFPFGGASANLLRNLATGIKKQNYEIEVILPRGNYYGKKIERVLFSALFLKKLFIPLFIRGDFEKWVLQAIFAPCLYEN